MRFVHALTALAFGSLALACGAPAESGTEEAPASSTAEALTKTGGRCNNDSSCVSADVCDLDCHYVPGQLQCQHTGGTCEPKATVTGASLGGQTFTSQNGAHSITFTYSTDPDTVHGTSTTMTFRKTDGCDPSPSGIRCLHIQLTTGTYSVNKTGNVVTLEADLGGSDSMPVETHYYDGLRETYNGSSFDLFPVPAAN